MKTSIAIVVCYLLLLAAAIPWYWPHKTADILFGLPIWVSIAVVVSLVTSIFTAWLLSDPWPEEREKNG